MAVIKRINNIPVCDIELRDKIAALKDLLDNKADANHEHEEYITKDELVEYATKTYVNNKFNEIDDLINNIDLSIYVTKQELENKKYLTSIPNEYITKSELDAMGFITKDSGTNSLATITYIDDKIAELKQYIDDTFALKSDADSLKAWAERLRSEIDNLYTGYEELKQRVDDLQNKPDETITSLTCDNTMNLTLEAIFKTGSINEVKEGYYVPYTGGYIWSDCFTYGCIPLSEIPEKAFVSLTSSSLEIVDVVFASSTTLGEGDWISEIYMNNVSGTVSANDIESAKQKGATGMYMRCVSSDIPDDMIISYEIKTNNEEKDANVVVVPNDYINDITWTIDKENIVSVYKNNNRYYIKALAKGTCRVTFYCGTATTSCDVTVVSASVPCTSLTCNRNMTLDIGNNANLNVNIQPSNTTDSLYWDISDTSALDVYKSSGGYWVHAVKSGSYTVTFYCGSCTSTCNVTVNEEFVKIPCQYITVSPSSATLSVGESISITGSAYPSDTTDYMMVSSSDVSVISIGSGSAGTETTKTVNPTAKGVGTASIIFNCNGVTGSCSITVK